MLPSDGLGLVWEPQCPPAPRSSSVRLVHQRRRRHRDRHRPPADLSRPTPPTRPTRRWYVNIDSVEWKTPPPLQIGSQVEFVARFLGRTLRYTYEFVELVPGERVVMRTKQGPFPMETTYAWDSEPDESTRMTLRNRGEPAGFSRLMAPLMKPAMRRANRKDLAKLKAMLESQPA